jgi:transcriptional regulator with XRE-family HTH domain
MTLKTARQLAGLTQEQLSLRAGVDEAIICRLEKGKQKHGKTDFGTIAKIAQALGLDHSNLFDVFPVPDGAEEKRETAAAATAAAR